MIFLKRSEIRLALWILLLGLTITILSYPITISPSYPLPVQTIYMFDNLPLFAALFYFWMLVLLVLLFSKGEGLWDKLGLCLIFSSVFVGFWTFITPWAGSGDALIHLGELRYIRETGVITPQAHQIFGYLDFSGSPAYNASNSRTL
jgi:hypothetical protein